jgi:hypothetical protein
MKVGGGAMGRLVAVLVFVVTLLVATAGMAAGQAQPRTYINVRMPDATSLTNPCNGETVELSGFAYSTSHVTTNPDDLVVSELSMVHLHFTGTGSETGARYTANIRFNGAVGGDHAVWYRDSVQIIGEGKVPDFKISLLFHLTLNDAGELTAEFSKFNSTCEGTFP